MAKFNEVQKKKRALKAQRKRSIHGDPSTGKLKAKPQNLSISGKRKRKLLKKWRRDQKEALNNGLITMEDVEMASADGVESQKDEHETPTKFPMKKKPLKLKQLKRRGKGKRKSTKPSADQATIDSMVE